MSNGGSVFTEFVPAPPERRAPETAPSVNLRSLPAGRLLQWILNFWDEPTISLREIRIYGPHATRNRKGAMDVAETLAHQGWFLPIRGPQCRSKIWRILRENEQMSMPRTNRTAELSPNH